MSEPLGFVVLARRPHHGHGYSYEPVSAVFPEYPKGLEQAQNVRKSCEAKRLQMRKDYECYLKQLDVDTAPRHDPVEYVIGAITERTP